VPDVPIEIEEPDEDDIGDDDPTRVVIRERSESPVPRAMDHTVEAGDSIIIEDEEIRANQEILQQARATAESAAKRMSATDAMVSGRQAPNLWMWMVFVLVAVVVGGIATFYLWRV
jgi:hypothetical protein